MTPASALSRLEKLAEKESWRYLVSIPAQRRDIERACVNVGKALLQILSEPGEACGPRVRLDYGVEAGADSGYWELPTISEPLNDLDGVLYVPEAELLQVRADWQEAIARLDHYRERSIALDAALASSEARVRSLLFVSEIAARTLKNLKHGLELSLWNCPGGADEAANKIHLQRIEETLKALLEVQG